MFDWDVIVVGGGPSGLTCAAELAAAGANTLVLERRADREGARRSGATSRAGTVLPRVLELFDARGIVDRFVNKTREINEFPLRTHHIWAGFQPIQWRYLESRFGFTLQLPQQMTEQLLEQWALEKGATIRYGAEVSAVRQIAGGVEVDCANASGSPTTLRARYLIGADGSRSVVRTGAGFPWEGRVGTFTNISVDAELRAPWPKKRMNISNELGWVTGYAFGEGITRFNIAHRDAKPKQRSEPVTVEEVRKYIRDVHGTDYGIESLRWAARVDDQMFQVPTLRKDRIFLVGESARVHYPASGVGMNFCIQDAFNLSWKLANVLKGLADCSTLDTYDDERLPVMQSLMESVNAQCALQFNFSAEGAALKRQIERHFLLLPDVQRKLVLELCGLEEPYPGDPGQHPLAGHRMPDVELVTPTGQTLRIGELLRQQEFVCIDLEGFSGQFDCLDTDGLPVRVVKAKIANVPSTLLGVKAIVLRPDAYVGWASNDASSTDSAIVYLQRWLMRISKVLVSDDVPRSPKPFTELNQWPTDPS